MIGMGAPHWYSCDPDPLVTGGVNQTDVAHYTIVLAVRRVDGLPFNTHGTENTETSFMGYRMQTTVAFRTRKVV